MIATATPLSADTAQTSQLLSAPDPARQALAKKYVRAQSPVVYGTGLHVGVCYSLFLPQNTMQILSWAQAISSNSAVIIGTFILTITGGYILLSLPMKFMLGYALPRKYGLSRVRFFAWLKRFTIESLQLMAVVIVIAEFFYLIAPSTGDFWGLVIAALWLILNIAVPFLTPLNRLGFDKMISVNDPELVSRLSKLCQEAGMPTLGLWMLPVSQWTENVQGWLLGIGPRSRIVLTDTMIQLLNCDELEAIMAHELAHYVQGTLWRKFAFSACEVILTTSALYVFIAVSDNVRQLGGAANLTTLPYFLLAYLGSYLIVSMSSNKYSRKDESAADRYAMRLTDNPDAFKSAMIRLADCNLRDLDPKKSSRNRGTHPVISDRIKAADLAAGRSNVTVPPTTIPPYLCRPHQVRRIRVVGVDIIGSYANIEKRSGWQRKT